MTEYVSHPIDSADADTDATWLLQRAAEEAKKKDRWHEYARIALAGRMPFYVSQAMSPDDIVKDVQQIADSLMSEQRYSNWS